MGQALSVSSLSVIVVVWSGCCHQPMCIVAVALRLDPIKPISWWGWVQAASLGGLRHARHGSPKCAMRRPHLLGASWGRACSHVNYAVTDEGVHWRKLRSKQDYDATAVTTKPSKPQL